MAQDGLHVGLFTGKRHRLGVTPDGLYALAAQAGEHAVGGHAQADAQIDQAVGSILGHMVGDAGAVHVGVAGTLYAMIVRAVGSRLGLGVLAGNAGVGDQAEIGTVGPGRVVTAGTVIVRGAVGVHDDQTAALNGVGDVIYGGVGHRIALTGSASRRIQAFPHGFVRGGIAVERAVGVIGRALPVGLDQADVHRGRPAALDSCGLAEDPLSLRLCPGDILGRGVVPGVVELRFHPGRVAAGDAHCSLPHQEAAVLLERTLHIGVGVLDRIYDLGDDCRIIRFGHVSDAAHGGSSGVLDRLDLGKDVVVKDGVLFLGIDVDRIAARSGCCICTESQRGREAQQHYHRQQKRKELGSPVSHGSYLPEKLLS